MFMLILGLVTVVFGFNNQHSEIISVIMAVIILTACIMFLIILYCFLVIHYHFIDKRNLKQITCNYDFNALKNDKIDGIILRLIVSQRNLFTSNGIE